MRVDKIVSISEEHRIAAQLEGIGPKYWALWILALTLYLAHRWAGGFILGLLFTFLLSVMVWKMIIPYIGLIWRLRRGIDGFTVPIMNNLVLAILNLFAVAYSMAGIWKTWPYVWVVLILSALFSLTNGAFAAGSRPESR